MTKLNKISFTKIIFDTDVITNWLTKEVDSKNNQLWVSPLKLVSAVENNKLNGVFSITNLMELRYVLRRKKIYSEPDIISFVNGLEQYFEIVLPDEGNLLLANKLQTEIFLGPFDSILLSICISLKPSILVSRDKMLLQISSQYVEALTPEDFLSTYNIVST